MLNRNDSIINQMEVALKKNNKLGMVKLADEINCPYPDFKNIISELEKEGLITIQKVGSRKQIIINKNKSELGIIIDDFNFKVMNSVIGDVILVSDLAKYLGVKSAEINDIIKNNEDNFLEKVGKIKVGKVKRVSINKNGVMELYKLMLNNITSDMNNKFIKLVNATRTQLNEEKIKGENLTYNKELDDRVNDLKNMFSKVIDEIVNDYRKMSIENNYLKQYNDKLALDKMNQKLIAESKLAVLEAGINKLRNARIETINNKYHN